MAVFLLFKRSIHANQHRVNTIETFYNETIDQVYGYVLTRIRNVAISEDIVSESYLKAIENFHTFENRKHASRKSWLFTIVRNTITDRYRRKSYGDTELSEEILDDRGIAIDEQIDIDTKYQEILSKIDVLPARQQEILLLRYKGELSNKEIAELLEIEEKSVSASLAKAIKELRSELTR